MLVDAVLVLLAEVVVAVHFAVKHAASLLQSVDIAEVVFAVHFVVEHTASLPQSVEITEVSLLCNFLSSMLPLFLSQ
jgi:hypothetical protein